MKCERCGKEEASIKLTRVEKTGSVLQVWLCQLCAAEASPYQKQVLQKQASFDMLLKELLKSQKGAAVAPSSDEVAQVSVEPCPSCGLEFATFKATSMLGCPDCYVAFAEHLEADLKRLHRGATRHVRESGAPNEELVVMQKQLQDMRDELKSAIEYEDFERAAFLRDEITSLEKRLKGTDPKAISAGPSGG